MLKSIMFAIGLAGALLTNQAQAADTCDCPAFALLHRPYYCESGLVYPHGTTDRPYMVLVYYTPARPPYYNIPSERVLIPYFGPVPPQ
jgi:hypothetical protein